MCTLHHPLTTPLILLLNSNSTSVVSKLCFAPKTSAMNITPRNLRTCRPTTNAVQKLLVSAAAGGGGGLSASKVVPARDQIIDFGKHKGRMLGTLPSNYLKWVSKNLRARDYEEWAKRAEQVLKDPVYRDRIEWELAEKVLNGDVSGSIGRISSSRGPVSELLELSERFGWNNEDKVGWSKINFGLLGTSKGGRIPRLVADERGETLNSKKEDKIIGIDQVEEVDFDDSRERRRERLKKKMKRRRRSSSSSSSSSRPIISTTSTGRNWGRLSQEFEQEADAEFGFEMTNIGHEEEINPTAATSNSPFPGRRSLFKKVLN